VSSTTTYRLFLLAIASILVCKPAKAQDNRPVLKSRSKFITIVDGDHVKKDYWLLMPEKNPDIYFVELPMKPHSVTFRSDIDSISFPVKFGDQHDFVIVLNETTSCPTQVRAAFKKLQPYSRTSPQPAGRIDTIPFRLGDNDKIYITGRLNGGKELQFQFDLGCGGSIIKEGSIPGTNMKFDGTANLINSDGNKEVPSSSSNRLEIENLRWDDLPFLVANNMTHRDDGILGNTLFQDKIIEINYDRSVIAIHDVLPEIAPTYSKHVIYLDGVVPFIQGSLSIGGRQREGWFMFDTGAYTSILYADNAPRLGKLFVELRKLLGLDNESLAPRLAIGDYAFADFNYSLENNADGNDRLGLLGNDILKRFNVILDNQNGFIYLNRNTLAGADFANPEYYLARVALWGGVISVACCGWLVQRRQRRRKSNELPLEASR
jgi:hypothetical protein